jgi:hypothetical protein
MSVGIDSIGFALVIGGLTYSVYLMQVPAHWISVGAIALLSLAILTDVKAMHQKDPAR